MSATTIDEDHCDQSADQTDVEEPVYEPFKSRLCDVLHNLSVTKDIDSISLLGSCLTNVIYAMEDTSIVRLHRMISNTPTTSSRHCVIQEYHNKKTGQGKSKQKVSLHSFQNMTLGTVTSNNLRFHITIYCVADNKKMRQSDYKPFTQTKCLAVIAALNLARLCCGNQFHLVHNILQTYEQKEDNDDWCHKTGIHISGMKTSLENLRQSICGSYNHTNHQHWLSGGENFYYKQNGRKPAEISTCKADAIAFVQTFEGCLDLVSEGILKLPEISNICISEMDKKCSGKKLFTPAKITEEANELSASKVYGLTAAGIKNDYKKFEPFNVYAGKLEGEKLKYTFWDKAFDDWNERAALHNHRFLQECFMSNYNFAAAGLFLTIDEGANFAIATDAEGGPLSELTLLPATQNLSRVGGADEDDSGSVGADEHDSNSIHSANAGVPLDSNRVVSVREEATAYQEVTPHNGNDDESSNLEMLNSEPCMNTFLSSFHNMHCSSPNRFQILLTMFSSNYHTGKIICGREYAINNMEEEEEEHDREGGKKTFRNISALRPKMRRPSNGDGNGDILGWQLYVTNLKNYKGLSSMSGLNGFKNLPRTTYGLMQASKGNASDDIQNMKLAIEEMERFQFNSSTYHSMQNETMCLRIEFFRNCNSIEYIEETYSGNTWLASSLNVLQHMPIYVVNKDCLISNYCNTLANCTEIIKVIFGNNGFGMNPSDLPPNIKMSVQLAAEILASEIGNAGEYSEDGPITKSICQVRRPPTHFNNFYKSFPYREQDQLLSDKDCLLYGVAYGVDPKHWVLFDPGQSTDCFLEYSRTQLSNGVMVEGSTNETHFSLSLDIGLVQKTLAQFRRRLFRYHKAKGHKNMTMWLIFISKFITINLSSNSTEPAGNAFDAINYKAFCALLLKDHTTGSNHFDKILRGLANIFIVCYHWEWRTDVLHSKIFGLLCQMDDNSAEYFRGLRNNTLWPCLYDELHKRIPKEFLKKHGNPPVVSINDLQSILFRDHDREMLKGNGVLPSTNWKSCIYLQIYCKILGHLQKAEEYMRTRSNDIPDNVYKFHPAYFMSHIAEALIKNKQNSYVWGTTQKNRKRYLSESHFEFHSIDCYKIQADLNMLRNTFQTSVNPWSGVDPNILRKQAEVLKKIQIAKNGKYVVESFLRKTPYKLISGNMKKKGPLKLEAVLVLSIYHRLFGNNIAYEGNEGLQEKDWNFLNHPLQQNATTVYDDIAVFSFDSLVPKEYKNVSLSLGREATARLEVAFSFVHYLWKLSKHFAEAHRRTKSLIMSRVKRNKGGRHDLFLREAYNAARSFRFDISGREALLYYANGHGLPGVSFNLVLGFHQVGKISQGKKVTFDQLKNAILQQLMNTSVPANGSGNT